MNCPSCGFENEAGAKFCKSCGAKLITQDVVNSSSVKTEKSIQNQNNDSEEIPTMTKGCKIWFWIVLVLNAITAFANLSLMSYAPGTGIILVLAGVVMVSGAAMILFKQSKTGLYLVIGAAVLGCIANLASHINPAYAVISAVINPLISYYFVNKNSAVIK